MKTGTGRIYLKKKNIIMAVVVSAVLFTGSFCFSACGETAEEKQAVWEEEQQRRKEEAEAVADKEIAALDMELIEYLWDEDGKEGFLRFVLYYGNSEGMAWEDSSDEGNDRQTSQIQGKAADILFEKFNCDTAGQVTSMSRSGDKGELWYRIEKKGNCPDAVTAGFGESRRKYPLSAGKKLELAVFDVSGAEYVKEMIMTPVSIEITFDEDIEKIKDRIAVTANMKGGEQYLCALYEKGTGNSGTQEAQSMEGAESIAAYGSWSGDRMENIFKVHLRPDQIASVEINGTVMPMTIDETAETEEGLSRKELEEMGREGAMTYLDIYYLCRKFRTDPDELLDNIIKQWGEERFSPFDSVKVYAKIEWEKAMQEKYGDVWRNW